jgi:hypothetical protein
LAATQYGLVARWQAIERGWTHRMLRWRVQHEGWREVQPGVYLVGGAPWSWQQQTMAAVLSAGPDALASQLSAAAIWGFEGIYGHPVEVTSSRWLRRPRGDVVLHESKDVVPQDRARLRGIPLTSPLRTVIDVGCRVSLAQLEVMAVEGIRRGWFSYPELQRRHAEIARRGRNGAGPMRLILERWAEQDALADSGWEVHLGRLLERLGFPRPVRQFRIVDAHGNFVAQVDLAYPQWCIAIEADSESWHTGLDRFHHDRSRWNHVRAIGWDLLTYTYEHYRHDHPHIRRTLSATIKRRSLPEIA